MEEDLTRVQEVLAATKGGRHKVKVETARFEVERTSLLLELGVIKDEVSSLHSQVGRDQLPPEFFVNPGCPPVQDVVKATATKTPPSEAVKELMKIATAEDQNRL